MTLRALDPEFQVRLMSGRKTRIFPHILHKNRRGSLF